LVEDDKTLMGILLEQDALRLSHTDEDVKDRAVNHFMRQTDIYIEEKKPLLDIRYFSSDKKDSVILTEKAYDQRAEQRLRYRWPVRFARDVKEKTSPGQIVDVSSSGLAMLCHADKRCPHQDQLITIDFGVPHFGSTDYLDVVFFNRIGRVCRIDYLSNMVNRVAVQFAEPLFFKPGEQNISESDAQQRLQDKTYSITRAEEKAKVYGEALARTEEKLRSYAEAKAKTEERAKIEAKARAIVEEKVRAEAESIAELQEKTRAYAEAKGRAEERAKIEAKTRKKAEENVRAEIQKSADLEAQMQDIVKSYTDQIVKIKAEATEAIIWAKAEAEYTVAKVKDEFKQKDDVYSGAKIKTKIRTKAAIFIVVMLVVGTLICFYPKQRDKSVDYNNHGSIHLKKNEYDQAILDYTKAIEINPRLGVSYSNRALAYYNKREYDKAWQDVHKTESLGYVVHPGFLKALREASGRER